MKPKLSRQVNGRENHKDEGTKLLSFRLRTKENNNADERVAAQRRKGIALFRRSKGNRNRNRSGSPNSEGHSNKRKDSQEIDDNDEEDDFTKFEGGNGDPLESSDNHGVETNFPKQTTESAALEISDLTQNRNNLEVTQSDSLSSLQPNKRHLLTHGKPSQRGQSCLSPGDDLASASQSARKQPDKQLSELWDWEGSDMDLSSSNGNIDTPDDLIASENEPTVEKQAVMHENSFSDRIFPAINPDTDSQERGYKAEENQFDATPRLSNATLAKRDAHRLALIHSKPPPPVWNNLSSSTLGEKSIELVSDLDLSPQKTTTEQQIEDDSNRSFGSSSHSGQRGERLRSKVTASREISPRSRSLKSRDASRIPNDSAVHADESRRGFHLPIKKRQKESFETEESIHSPLDKSFRRKTGFSRPASPNMHKNDSVLDYHHQSRRGFHLQANRLRKWQHSVDSESDVRTKKEQVTEKVHRLRRRLNPRSNTVQWRYRIDENHSEMSGSDDEFVLDEMHTRGRRASWDGIEGERPEAANSVMNNSAGNLSSSCVVYPPPVTEGISVRSLESNHHHDVIEYRVKPHHCFFPDKIYMTEQEIYNDTLKRSENVEHVETYVEPWYPIKNAHSSDLVSSLWGSSRDGRIGSLRVEVLGCIGLPKNKPDVGVYLVCGDSAFATDVINGSRSPMWPAKSKRAVVFPIMHAFVRLYVGVFDILSRRNADNDSFFGRAMVDIALLRPHTDYDVTLPLRTSSFVYEKRARGVVRLRFSLHWFSERAAVLSYLREPKNLVSAYEEISQPSIRCADPKTFRNVAVTVHGLDLPGKYTRRAFQATMREFNLYRLNVIFTLKTTCQNAVMYEKPIMSVYLFVAWMHCVYLCSVRLVPVYFVGTLVYLLVENYYLFNLNKGSHLGYSPVTLQEILMSLVTDGPMQNIESFVATKKVKQENNNDTESETGALDHREFPFSEKLDYPKLSVEESVLRRHAGGGRKGREEEMHLAGRLSVYVKAGHPTDKVLDPINRNTSSSSTISTMSTDEDIHESNDSEGEEDQDHDDIHDDNQDWHYIAREHAEDLDGSIEWWYESGFNSSVRRIPSGPPQDTNVKPVKKIPPQVHLARVEEMLNKFTQYISQDRLYWQTLSLRPECETNSHHHSKDEDEDESQSTNTNERKRKRQPLDEFDKRLGLRRRHPNPVVEITSSFLGPLMRIFRIICISVRVVFNISVWRDPFLSFWALCGLIVLMVVLIVFPWRLFFFAVGIIALGPQNIFLRKHFARFQDRKEETNAQEHKNETNHGNRVERAMEWKQNQVESVSDDGMENSEVEDETADIGGEKRGSSRRRIHTALAHLKERRQRRRNDRTTGGTPSLSAYDSDSAIEPRPAFSGLPNSGTSFRRNLKHLQPREIIVPYSQFRKERFYDWPPDPTVSRATPVDYKDCAWHTASDGTYQADPILASGKKSI